MERAEFQQAKSFIYRDIEREIQLAVVSENDNNASRLREFGIHSGGGNFLAALGLLCYTEFAGKLKYNHLHASQNFNRFFDELGQLYSDFRQENDVYDIFRCGLAHEYYVKQTCTIAMFGGSGQAGIGSNDVGRYYFIVERYFRDFQLAFDKLEQDLFPSI